jgi:hypothetical protein
MPQTPLSAEGRVDQRASGCGQHRAERDARQNICRTHFPDVSLLEERERSHGRNASADQEIQDAIHRYCSQVLPTGAGQDTSATGRRAGYPGDLLK